jgi:MFS transporter, ACS family, hexuronate transporter
MPSSASERPSPVLEPLDAGLGLPRMTHYRWVVCALLFFVTTVNYVDRQVLGILGPTLTDQYDWSESDFANIVNSFTIAYAVGYLVAGRLMDRIGARIGFAMVVGIWSLAAMGHGVISWLPPLLALTGFCAARGALGLAEGGNFPAAIKTVSDWFPKKERALSTGIFNSGANLGAIAAAYIVAWVLTDMQWGWPAAFYVTGALGFVWLAFWLWLYRSPEDHPRVSAGELAYIRSDPADPPSHMPWLRLLRYRQTWAFAIGMFVSSPVWWFFLYWLPKFLKNNHGIDVDHVFWPTTIVYCLASVGSVGGGWLSSALIQRGATLNFARKAAFLVCALCVLPVAAVARVSNLWVAVILVGVACAAHAGFSANLYPIVSDTVPRKAVSSVVGIGGMAACLGSLVFSKLVGWILDWTKETYGEKDYLIPFLIASSLYLVATVIIHLMLPTLEPMEIEA